ncbi:hypothetical protein D3C77_684050 [compost metagenome]
MERERILQVDREDARAMQTDAMKSDDVFVGRFIYFYAAALTLLTFVFVFYASFVHQYTEDNKGSLVLSIRFWLFVGCDVVCSHPVLFWLERWK